MIDTVDVKCKFCREWFKARVADRKRGWGQFCSKTCKAKHQERRTHQNANHQKRANEQRDVFPSMTSGPWGHGQT